MTVFQTYRGKRNSRWPAGLLAAGLTLLVLGSGSGLAAKAGPGEAPSRKANRLIKETSPYLRLHAYNPVDWHPWGPEALKKARQENKPIFLSIGYSTCHWCHVMAKESFENPEIATILNEHFICIKVDREERPDVDETYMNAALMLLGQGGWPLSVFLTPELQPFFAGTYFPPKAFGKILIELSRAYRQKPKEVAATARELTSLVKAQGKVTSPGQKPGKEVLTKAYKRLEKSFDGKNGGFGSAPKFPEALDLNFLLHYYHFARQAQALDMVSLSLEKMARGGIYDQAGGGFHRYATDAGWLVPHFEKMLYDNALIPQVYLAHYQITKNELSRRVAKETLDFVIRDLGAPQGGFYSALDAQSEGEEGKYYVWTLKEINGVVGTQAAPLVRAALGVTEAGNFKGKNILTRPRSEAELGRRFSQSPDKVRQVLGPALEQLRQVRAKRVPPARDEKIIVSWNGLMISTLAQGSQVLGDQRYYQAAAGAARFILKNLVKKDRLHRIWADGQVSVPGFLEDYAFLSAGLLELFETDFDPQWLLKATWLVDRMDALFLDPGNGMYFFVGQGEETPLVRSQSIYDMSLPSGNAVAALACLKLYRFTGEKRFRQRAHNILARLQGRVREVPLGFTQLLTVQTLYLTPALELTLVGNAKLPQVQEMLQVVYGNFLPERRLVVKNPQAAAGLEELVPSIKTYSLKNDRPVAYLCRLKTCLPPISTPAELTAKLAQFEQKTGSGSRQNRQPDQP